MKLLATTLLLISLTSFATQADENRKRIVLTPDECMEVAITVARAVHQPKYLIDKDMTITKNSKQVARHIIKDNDMAQLKTIPPEDIYMSLARACLGAEGVSDVVEPI